MSISVARAVVKRAVQAAKDGDERLLEQLIETLESEPDDTIARLVAEIGSNPEDGIDGLIDAALLRETHNNDGGIYHIHDVERARSLSDLKRCDPSLLRAYARSLSLPQDPDSDLAASIWRHLHPESR